MKTLIKLSLGILASAFMLTGCMEKEVSAPESAGEKVSFKFCSDEIALKSAYGEGYKLVWDDARDKVGVFIGTSTVNAEASISRDENGTAIFTAAVSPYQAGDMVCGYYPYTASVGTLNAAVLEIPSVQIQYEEKVFNGAYNPLIVRPKALENGSDAVGELPVSLQFYQVAAVAEFDVYSSNASYVGEQVKSITFKADNVAGSFALDLSSGNPAISELKSAGNEVSVHMNKFVLVSATEQERLIYLAMVPGEYSGQLVLTTDRATYTYEGQQLDYDRASCRRFKLDLNRGTREVKTTGIYSWEPTQSQLNAMTSTPQAVGSPELYWYINGSNYCFDAADTEAHRGVSIGNKSSLTDITLSTVDYKGIIKAVVVNAAVSNRLGVTKAELTVSVNGTEVETKTIETYAYGDGKEGQTAGQPMDYVFKLAEPVENGRIDVHYKLVTCEEGSPNGMYLKSIQILDKDFEIETVSLEEMQSKWSTPYMTFNEAGWLSENGKKLWDGSHEGELFMTHSNSNKTGGLAYGDAFIVVDLGVPTSIACIGCHCGSSRWGTAVNEVEFFFTDKYPLTPGITDDWQYIFNSANNSSTSESTDGYKNAHAKMLAYDATVDWISLGERKQLPWYYQRDYNAHMPYNKVGVYPKARYIKVQIKNWSGDRGVLSEIWVSRVKSVDGQPL